MKKIFLILALCSFLNASAEPTQIKYDSIKNYSYVEIAPVVIFKDTIERMCLKIIDNAINEGVIYYEFRAANSDVIMSGNLYLRGDDYNEYSTNEYLYNYVANKLGILIKP
jgi:hypothetical protein